VSGDELSWIDEDSRTDLPRYCPACKREADPAETICVHCGESLAEQSYCPVCENYWRKPAGDLCPKHDINLEESRSNPAAAAVKSIGPAPPWVTVGIYQEAMNAEAVRIRLEAEGIPTFLEGSRMGSRSMYTVATGGVKLQVPEPLATDARILLAQSWSLPPAIDDLDDAWDDLAPETDTEAEDLADPSDHVVIEASAVLRRLLDGIVRFGLFGWLLVLFSLLIFLLFTFRFRP
jgi:hypothetical protein